MIDFDRMALLWYPLAFVLGWKITSRAIFAAAPSFIQAGLKGNDMGRKDRPEVFFFYRGVVIRSYNWVVIRSDKWVVIRSVSRSISACGAL